VDLIARQHTLDDLHTHFTTDLPDDVPHPLPQFEPADSLTIPWPRPWQFPEGRFQACLQDRSEAGQLVINLVKSILNHAARPAPRRLIVGLAGCPPTKPLGLDTLHRAREQLQQNPGIIGHRKPLFYLKSVADRQVEA
jgi:hypothetical protein